MNIEKNANNLLSSFFWSIQTSIFSSIHILIFPKVSHSAVSGVWFPTWRTLMGCEFQINFLNWLKWSSSPSLSMILPQTFSTSSLSGVPYFLHSQLFNGHDILWIVQLYKVWRLSYSCFENCRPYIKFQLQLTSEKAGRFEKLFGFARSHSFVILGSVSIFCATVSHPSCFSKS